MKSIFSNPDHLLNLATRYLENNQLIESIAILEKIINLYPKFGPAYNCLGGIAFFLFDNFTEARAYFEKALEVDPQYPITYVNYAKLLNQLEKHKYLADFASNALKVPNVDKAKIYEELGKMYEKERHLEDALKMYDLALNNSLDTLEVENLLSHLDRCNVKLEIRG